MRALSNRAGILAGMTELPPHAPGVRVVERCIDLLEAVQRGPMSLAQLCRVTGLSRPTAARLLAGLLARAMVVRDEPGGAYSTGPNLLRLAQGAVGTLELLLAPTRSTLEQLSFETGETVAVHVRSGVERLYVAEVPSAQSIRYTAIVGSVAPVHTGSSGTVLLAFADHQVRNELLDVLSVSAMVDRAEIQARTDTARRDGFAIDLDARLAGVSAISIPVHGDGLVLSLSVIGPSHRLSAGALADLLPSMRHAAVTLEAFLA
jgi:DNA-binding IclR family transcriptional regulator